MRVCSPPALLHRVEMIVAIAIILRAAALLCVLLLQREHHGRTVFTSRCTKRRIAAIQQTKTRSRQMLQKIECAVRSAVAARIIQPIEV